MAQGYKCDRCGKWYEGEPANRGHHEWLFARKVDLYSMQVRARIILSEPMSFDGQDLCLACFIDCLEKFIDACKDRLKKKY